MTKKRPSEKSSNVLSALTASAMALPGLAGDADADSPVEQWTVDGAVSFYREDKLRPKRTTYGNPRKRMEINSYQFRVVAPVSSRSDLEVNVGFETLSGGSPWFVLPDLAGDRDGRPVQVMSGATIDEDRVDVLATGSYYFDSAKVSGSTGFSVENDYASWNLGFSGDYSFNDNNTTLSSGVGLSLDWINPTDSTQFDRISSDNKQSFSVFAGLSQVLTRHSTMQSTLSFEYSTGYLSDPYKKSYIVDLGTTVRDARPDNRKSFTWLTRYRHHVSKLDGTLHADYKLYVNDWSVNSHTFDIAWYQSIPWNIQIIPSIRYYSQSQADFYELYYEELQGNNLYSSDYRLSPYGAFSYRIKAQVTLDHVADIDWVASVSYERYESSGSLAFQSVDVQNPGLVSFHLFAARITARF